MRCSVGTSTVDQPAMNTEDRFFWWINKFIHPYISRLECATKADAHMDFTILSKGKSPQNWLIRFWLWAMRSCLKHVFHMTDRCSSCLLVTLPKKKSKFPCWLKYIRNGPISNIFQRFLKKKYSALYILLDLLDLSSGQHCLQCFTFMLLCFTAII